MNPVNNTEKLYELWLERTADMPELHDELESVRGNADEIEDRFYRDLEFGTAGLRGVLGAGTNRMNSFTVNRATQGLADMLNANFDSPSVAIAYDSRINSDVFARGAAGVLAANGIKVYIYKQLMPTPMLSFAVRRLGCSSGIIITASHNPSKYNGYKCYDPNGYQMTDASAAKTYSYIEKADIFDGVKTMDFDEAMGKGLVSYIEDWLVEDFYRLVMSKRVNPGICRDSGLKVIYTPLNGTGNLPVREILRRCGLEDVTVVPEQELPDGRFPTCQFPNPEIRASFDLAIAIAEKQGADLLLATDPDCDRVGIAVNDGGEYKLITGNEMCVLLSDYLLNVMQEKGTLPLKPVLIKSFVTTDMVDAVAAKYGASVMHLLTGFKYTGEQMTLLENSGEADRFILGMEESYGYVTGMHSRDKDAVVASMLICEMAAYYKKRGMNLYRVLCSLYEEHGMYLSRLDNFAFEGASGMEKMSDIMDSLRAEAPAEIAGLKVLKTTDMLSGMRTDLTTGKTESTGLPSSNVLSYNLPGNSSVIVRPSGTEPKIKLYITAVAKDETQASVLAQALADDMKKLMKV